jgi:hypothetical protein
MGTRLGEFRFREGRLVGFKLGLVIYPPSVGLERGFKMVFRNIAGVKIGELGSDSNVAKVSELNFELADFGCGGFSFDLVAWFTGFIQKTPESGAVRPYTFEGFGFYDQLSWVFVTKDYSAGQDISAVVKDIISTIVAPNTQIAYNEAKVEATGYTLLGDISFDHITADEAVQTLAEAAQNFEFGVDSGREFYFRAVSSAVVTDLWQGKHFQTLEVQQDPSQIRNKLHVKVGEIQVGGTNFIDPVSDPDSIAAYGLREDVISAPEVLGTSDATRWAQYRLSQVKDPIIQIRIMALLLDQTLTKLEARGMARVTAETAAEYTQALRRVNYHITPAGITADLELGQIAVPLELQIVSLLRAIQEEQRLGDQRTKQLF